MSLLPIFLKLDGRQCLVVGAGTVALDKIRTLLGLGLNTGLRLRVVAPEGRAEVRALAAEGKLEWIPRAFVPSNLDGSFIVIAATDVPAVNAEVYRSAVARGIPSNSVDDIPNCDFFFGSVVSRGKLQIAISTAGESPAVFIEAGPGKVLTGLMKQIDPAQRTLNVEDAASLRKTLAELAALDSTT